MTWAQDLQAGRDLGLNLYENLQYYDRPGYRMGEDDWRSFQAMSQLTQRRYNRFFYRLLTHPNVDEALRFTLLS